jgi:hypothetical protein
VGSLRETARRLRGLLRRVRSSLAGRPRKPVYAIGIYTGVSPLDLAPGPIKNPVLTHEHVTDVPATFVADPFMIRAESTWYMFFELANALTRQGEIGLARSDDGLRWTYVRSVLREPYHLSYPYVFRAGDAVYMLPETVDTKSIRLYKALDFPTQWSHAATLVSGQEYGDPSIVFFNERWWLFSSWGAHPFHADTLRLFHAGDLFGPWVEHQQSPIVDGNLRVARPAGRVLVCDDRILRYAQDCYPYYGTRVRAFEVTELTTRTYREREIRERPVLEGSGKGWNRSGMHHVDPHRLNNGQWIACVDGWRWRKS